MLRVLSRAQMRDFDRLASEVAGVASVVLMENAGRGAAEIVARELGLGERSRKARVAIVCGAGNNAGDGFVVGRRLLVLGADVEVVALAAEDRLRGDALANHRAYVAVGGAVVPADGLDAALARADLVVDALFGTGLDRAVDGVFRSAIERINAGPARRVALDVPSGLDADTGQVLGAAVRADVTVTFAAHKLGLLTPNGAVHAGRVEVADIGLPLAAIPQAAQSAFLLEDADVRELVGRRAPNAHKATSGRVLVLAGSPGKVGAALLVAHGALRAGAGLVTLAGTAAVADALDQRVLEAMTARFDPAALDASLGPLLAATDVVAMGPGLGLDAGARRLVEYVVGTHRGALVLDADAISAFKDRASELAGAPGRLVLTPHAGEMARLVGGSASEVEADRFGALGRAVAATRATVLLKGPRTLVGTPGAVPAIGELGSPVLATGGTGDVLTGVVAALACRLEAFAAAKAGVFLHARAAARWARARGADRGALAHEIADEVPLALADLSAGTALLPD